MYTVVLLDPDDCEVSNTEEDTYAEAKDSAKAKILDPEYLKAGAHKVEVRDAKGACIWDRFRPDPNDPRYPKPSSKSSR